MADDNSVQFGVADFLANPEQPVGPRLKDSLMYGVQQQPDVQGQVRAYARKLGVPLPSALSDPTFVKAQGQVQDLDPNGMVLGSPKTANWLAEPDNAAVAHDDVDVLTSIEQTIKNLGGIAKGSAYTLGASVYSAGQALNEFIDPFGDLGLATRRQLDPRTGKFTEVGGGSRGAVALDATRRSMEQTAQAAMPTTENWMQAGVNSGIASLLQNAPGVAAALITKNPELGLAIMGGQTGASAYGEARDAGLAPGAAALHAGKQGATEVLTEKLPMEALLKDLKVGSGLVKTWLHQVASDVPGEITATMMQDFNDWADLHPDKPFTDYIASRPAAVGETIIATMMGTAGHTALEQVAHAAAGHAGKQAGGEAQAAQAGQTQTMLEGMAKAATASKLRERDPQTFKEYVDAVTQDTPAERVYINAQDLVDVLGQGSPDKVAENAQVLQAMPSVMPQLEDALKSGGLVEIPTSELLAFTPDTALGQAMMEHLKVDPEAMSMAEGEHFMQTQGESFKAEVEKVMADKGLADEFQVSAEAVRTGIKAQLDTVNRFTGDVNEAYAGMVGAFYSAQAARLGVTPEQLFEQHPLTVQATGVGALAQDTAFDLTPDNRLKDAKLGYTTLSYRVSEDGTAEIGSIRTPQAKRGQGSARRALQQFVQAADAQGRVVKLGASPLDKKTKLGKLVDFYASLGFQPTGRTINAAGEPEMVREPQALNQGDDAEQFAQMPKEDFAALLAKSRAQREARETTTAELTQDDKAVRFGHEQEDRRALVSPDLQRPGYWRLTRLDANGPVGHSEYSTKAEAVEDALREHYEPISSRALAQGDAQARGTFNPATNTIALLRNADLSTFLHETGHFYLETLARLAADENAPQEIKDDFATAMRWMAEGNEKATPVEGLEAELAQAGDTMFHGSQVEDLSALHPSVRGALGPGVYFTPNENIARRYGDALYETLEPEGVFNGLGSRDSRVNPYQVWRDQVARLVAHAGEHAAEVQAIAERMQPADGYPFFRRLEVLFGSTEGAQALFKAAGFTGLSGHADGPEIVLFDEAVAVHLVKTLEQGGRDGRDTVEGIHPDLSPQEWLDLPIDQRRAGHEKFARGFEAYLREGRAPAPALQPLFQRFKSWLMHIYQNLTQLNVELTPEVRSVMDRLLATDQEIAQAENARAFTPVFDTRPDGMSDLEWEAYQRLGSEATSDAQDELAGRSIRDMRWLTATRNRMLRALTKEAREKRAAVRAEVEAEVHSEPVYAAQQFLRRGIRNGEAFEGPHKLAIADVEKMYGELPKELQDWRKLGYGRYGMLADDGLHPDHVAEWFGFTSGDELVEALLNAEPMRAKIEGLTDQRMLERYGDLTDPDAIAKAADEAIHNDARLRFVATEANALAKAAGKTRVMAEAARDFAKDLIGRQRIRDVKPGKYTGAETRAARAAAQAHAKGELVEAATQKRNQLINGYAAKAAYQAQRDVEAALRYFARLDGAGARKSLDPGYRDQIDQLLERFDLRKGESLKAIDKRKSLAAWIKAMQDRGLDPVIDDQLANEAYRKHYKDMTVDELRGLVDAVRNIAHLGRLKNRLLVAAKGRAFQAVVDESEALIREKAYQTRPDKIEHNTVADRVLSGFRGFLAQHRKLASLIREMSGMENNDSGGVLWRAFIEPMNEANDREAVMREAATIKLAAIFKPIVEAGGLRTKMFLPELGRSLTLEGRLAIALNWGNELNRARIMDGEKWSEQQAQAVLSTLTADQLQFVNQVWEALDSYWPEIAAKERRVTGVEPEKVEAVPFQLHSSDGQLVDMRGGYYPIKYDTERSSRSEADDLAEALRGTMQGLYTRATTRRGHTKARVDKVERPVRKDLGVPFQHVNQVIHDLSFHEFLIDANRLLGHPQIDSAIRDHYGVEVLRTMRKTLDDIAVGDSVAENALDRVINHMRTGSTVVGLGLNLMTAAQQPLGLTQSIVRIGPKYMAKGIGMAFRDAVSLESSLAAISEKSDFMRLRAKTMMREINEVQNKVRSGVAPEIAEKLFGKNAAPVKNGMDAVHGSFFTLITKLQLVADIPTWLGAYNKAQAQGHDDATAVHLADQAVRDSQGSGQIGDLAQIQRGSVWFKLWTNFYSFFSIGYNQLAESTAETRRVGPSRLPYLASDFLLVAVMPAILGELLKKALRGDDWDWEKIAPDLAKAQLSYLFGFMVGLRELGSIIQSDGKSGGPSGLRLLTSDLPKLYEQAKQGEWDDAARKATLNVAGTLLHFPAAQVNRTIDGFEAMAKGETRNPMSLFFGPPKT